MKEQAWKDKLDSECNDVIESYTKVITTLSQSLEIDELQGDDVIEVGERVASHILNKMTELSDTMLALSEGKTDGMYEN